MLLEGKTLLVVGTTPFAKEAVALLAAEGGHVIDEAPDDSCELDILVDLGGEFAAKPFLKVTDEEWRTGFEDNVVRSSRYARRVLPLMLLANRGIVVFLMNRGEAEVRWEVIHREVTYRARQTLVREIEELVKGTDIILATAPHPVREGPPEEGSATLVQGDRQLDASLLVAFVAELVRGETSRRE